VTGVQTCALPIWSPARNGRRGWSARKWAGQPGRRRQSRRRTGAAGATGRVAWLASGSIAAFLADAGVSELVVQFAAFEPGRAAGFLVDVAAEHGVIAARWQDGEGQLVLAGTHQLDVVT